MRPKSGEGLGFAHNAMEFWRRLYSNIELTLRDPAVAAVDMWIYPPNSMPRHQFLKGHKVRNHDPAELVGYGRVLKLKSGVHGCRRPQGTKVGSQISYGKNHEKVIEQTEARWKRVAKHLFYDPLAHARPGGPHGPARRLFVKTSRGNSNWVWNAVRDHEQRKAGGPTTACVHEEWGGRK